MRHTALFLLVAASLVAQVPAKDAADGWIQLFDGDTNFGWTPEGSAQWSVVGKTLGADGSGKGWLRSNAVFADFILRFDYRQGKDGNSGVFIRCAKEGQPHETGYEVQLWEGHPKYWTGSLVNHIQAKKVKPKPGVWHTMQVQAEGDHFTVTLDGKTILDGHDSKSRMGHIGLQANEGKRIEFRNIMLKPLGLNPLFNGKDLSGWKVFDTSSNKSIKEPAVWSVKDGMMHVEKGPGQIETVKTVQNFVLQLDVRANSADPKRHPNSGVFLRGEPNGWWSGYESQIRNEYQDNDPTKVVDYGTGGIYRYNNARKIVAKDNEFFTKTIVADGRHFSVWVNGYQVTDLEDANPQAKLTPGTISLQAHDPTTNLDFKNIRIAELK